MTTPKTKADYHYFTEAQLAEIKAAQDKVHADGQKNTNSEDVLTEVGFLPTDPDTDPETETITVQIPKFNQISGERADHDWYREVRIPAGTPDADLLEKVFELGQNDFQPQDCPSVSVGNVIHNPRTQTLHLVAPMGFTEITDRVYAVWTHMNVYAVQSYSYKS